MPIPASRRRGNDAYNAKCDRIEIKPLQPVGADIRAAAAAAGQSVQRYTLQAIRDRMARDGFQPNANWTISPSDELNISVGDGLPDVPSNTPSRKG